MGDRNYGIDPNRLADYAEEIKNIIDKGNMKDKSLFIFDQVGKQVNWLMYYLVDNGYSNFYFLDGGATAVLKSQDYR